MSTLDRMTIALGQLEMADASIKPGELTDIASANLHTALFYLMAAMEAATNPNKQLGEIEAVINEH